MHLEQNSAPQNFAESLGAITDDIAGDDELLLDDTENDPTIIPLASFIEEFGVDLLQAAERDNPPVYAGNPVVSRAECMQGLMRKPFPAQADAVQALSALLFDVGEKAGILNAEMGTGKTMMAICLAAVAGAEGYRNTMIISPPHLVYKWRREIMETIPKARVWVLNGPDTLVKLLKIRQLLQVDSSQVPEFFVIGRVRMRLGYHWRHAVAIRRHRRLMKLDATDMHPMAKRVAVSSDYAACPHCGEWVLDEGGELAAVSYVQSQTNRLKCRKCAANLWTLMRSRAKQHDKGDIVKKALCQLPTIGPKTAEKLIGTFGADMLEGMLADNIYEFVNLMDNEGELVFSDRQASRMEKALANMEFSFGQGGYQPTEFVKRYLPRDFLDLLIVDEGHEYKNEGSAQGQAMGVLASKAKKVLLLTGTLMGGYASDLFFLLWRIMPSRMIEMGYRCNTMNGSMAQASLAFMRDHGVLKEIMSVREGDNHKTSRGKKTAVSTTKGPGFGPSGIAQCVLPFTVFLKLKDIGQKVLPPYNEHYVDIEMEAKQRELYSALSQNLSAEMRSALRRGDKSLLGVVLNTLLAWPDTCFLPENVVHPRSRATLAFTPSLFSDDELMPKEQWLLDYCVKQKEAGRRVLVYTSYTGKRDTCQRLKNFLQARGIRTAVLRAQIATTAREDWVAEQVDKGIDVLICNPELVKTGLDLLEFPDIVFMQTGYNVYTVMQAARRSWRIGQTEDVHVTFLGYNNSAQSNCLALMAEKIAVSQSTSGDIPDCGLDSLNQTGDSIEVAMARDLIG
ncbi:MAG: SNF2-related protein [Marinagarivorans sp.]|nr:SNF2-related protein [Marinagarivorans sp.]